MPVRWNIFTSGLLLLAQGAFTSALAATGSAACAACHAEIYKSYIRTPMALSSGHVGTGDFQERFDKGEFTHAPSGVRYRIRGDRKGSFFDFDATESGARINGSRRLDYFIGSGTAGRSYLYSADGFLYQAPVAYYSSERRWDLSPGFQRRDHLYLIRPVGVTCLQCHTSRLQPVAGTLNGFAAEPFLEGGIACERCHGSGEEHIAKFKPGSASTAGSGIVNPAKLAAGRRDSICAQCHLSGVARIEKEGRDPGSFQAGSLLSDQVSVFVWSGATAEMKVTSHFEKLAQSRCKIASGDRLWCGSCHNPHSLPAENEKAGYFRAKCLACHATGVSCKATAAVRARNGNNCIACHMPKNSVIDVAHTVYTDHAIPRRGATLSSQIAPSAGELELFGGGAASDRDLGLAYAFVIENERNQTYEARAFDLLTKAIAKQPNDIPALVQLANMYLYRSQEDQALELYERAVRTDPNEKAVRAAPSQIHAKNRLAAHYIKEGRMEEAIRILTGALEQSPSFEEARINLAIAQFEAGDPKSAQATVSKGLELNPASAAVRLLANRLRQMNIPK